MKRVETWCVNCRVGVCVDVGVWGVSSRGRDAGSLGHGRYPKYKYGHQPAPLGTWAAVHELIILGARDTFLVNLQVCKFRIQNPGGRCI